MANTKKCGRLNGHDAHEWSELVQVPPFESPHGGMLHEVSQVNWCEGIEHDRSPEGLTNVLGFVEYRDLTRLTFELETREKVPTRFDFADLVPGDSRVGVTVVDGDDRWAMVEIRILARKPFKVTETDYDEEARRLF